MKRIAVCLLLLGTILVANTAHAGPTLSGHFPVITAANVSQLVPIRLLTRGIPNYATWSADSKSLSVLTKNTNVVWVYNAVNFQLPPRRLEWRNDHPVEFWISSDGQLLRDLSFRGLVQTGVILDGRPISTITNAYVAFSPRDGFVAYTQNGHTTTLMNLKTHQTRSIEGLAVAFSPDDSLLATQSGGKTIRLWNTAQSTLIRTISSKLNVMNVVFGPDSRFLLTEELDMQVVDARPRVRLWQLSSSQPVMTWEAAGSIRFRADGTMLAISENGGVPGPLVLWDLKTHESVNEFPEAVVLPVQLGLGGLDTVSSAYWSKLAIIQGSSIRIQDMLDHLETTFEVAGDQWARAEYLEGLSPDLSKRVSINPDDSITIYDRQTGSGITTLSDYLPNTASWIFSPDGRSLIARRRVDDTGSGTSNAKIIKFLNLQTDAPPVTMVRQQAEADGLILSQAAFRSDGKTLRLLISNSENLASKIQTWDIATARQFDESSIAMRGDMSSDGTRLLSVDGTTVKPQTELWDLETRTRIAILTGCRAQSPAVAISPDSQLVACSGAGDNPLVYIWNARTGAPIADLKGCTIPYSGTLIFSPDHRFLACTSRFGDFTRAIWEISTGKPVMTSTTIEVKGFSPDGTRCFGGTVDGKSLSVWSMESGQAVFSIGLTQVGWNQIMLNADNTLVLTNVSAPDGLNTGFWNLENGKPIDAPAGAFRSQYAFPIALSQDGTQLIVGSSDGSVWIWAVQ